MEGFDAHPGTVKLALALSRRMKKENESPLALDFGEIQANSSLVTNTKRGLLGMRACERGTDPGRRRQS